MLSGYKVVLPLALVWGGPPAPSVGGDGDTDADADRAGETLPTSESPPNADNTARDAEAADPPDEEVDSAGSGSSSTTPDKKDKKHVALASEKISVAKQYAAVVSAQRESLETSTGEVQAAIGKMKTSSNAISSELEEASKQLEKAKKAVASAEEKKKEASKALEKANEKLDAWLRDPSNDAARTAAQDAAQDYDDVVTEYAKLTTNAQEALFAAKKKVRDAMEAAEKLGDSDADPRLKLFDCTPLIGDPGNAFDKCKKRNQRRLKRATRKTARDVNNAAIEARIERADHSFAHVFAPARESRCATAICWGPSNRFAFEPLADFPIGKTFSVPSSAIAKYINGSGIDVEFVAGLRFWAAWDWFSLDVHISTPLTESGDTISIRGSPHEYPANQIRRPTPGLGIGLFADTLWLGIDFDQLRNGSTEATRDPRFAPNEVVSRAFTFTIAVAPVASARNGIGTAVAAKKRREAEEEKAKKSEEIKTLHEQLDAARKALQTEKEKNAATDGAEEEAPERDEPAPPEVKSLRAELAAMPEVSNFSALVEKSAYAAKFDSDEEFTVFAPTNEALGADLSAPPASAGTATVDAYVKKYTLDKSVSKDELGGVASLRTADGTEHEVTSDANGLSVGKAALASSKNVKNGTIHVLTAHLP